MKNQTVVSCYSAGLLLTHVSTRPSTAADKGLGGFGATLGGFKLGEKVGYNIGWAQDRMGIGTRYHPMVPWVWALAERLGKT